MDCKVAKNLLLISFIAETFFASYGLLLGAQTAVISVLYFIAGLILVFHCYFFPKPDWIHSANRSPTDASLIKYGADRRNDFPGLYHFPLLVFPDSH